MPASEVARARPGPLDPDGEIVLEPPPRLPEPAGRAGAGQLLTYLPMLAGAGATGLLVTGSGGQPITYLASGMMALSMLGMAVNGAGRGAGEGRRRLDARRRDYQRYLERVRGRVREVATRQRVASVRRHPDPDDLWSVMAGRRLWERRPDDDDFLSVRIGLGPQPLAVRLVAPDTETIDELEPVSAAALREFVRTHGSVHDLPATLRLASVGRVRLRGSLPARRALARAMIAQLAAFHSPDDVLVAVCADGAAAAEWDWLKWLPHALSRVARDAVGPQRLAAADLSALETQLADVLDGRPPAGAVDGVPCPHVVVVLDGGRAEPDTRLFDGLVAGCTVLDVSDSIDRAADGVLDVLLDGNGGPAGLNCSGRDAGGGEPPSTVAVADQLSVVAAESLARQLCPLGAAAGARGGDRPGDPGLPELLGLGEPDAVDPAVSWQARPARDRLRVPLGVGPDGRPVELDLKESAEGGMGPHGLLVGATGSGKSELLRTLVLGLALTHSSEQLNFVLVDFKGGATFASLDALPHTSAVITNLEDELMLVDRMRDAIQGELVRRQEALRAGGNLASQRDYERAREQGASLTAMPSLFIVVDEFSELLSAKPDFIDLFVMIGRLGRSLGVHLLLASQRLDEGRLRGLDTHLSYRIGLRTFSASESKAVLGVPDAHTLPAAPGSGLLKDATGGLARFTAAYVSGRQGAFETSGARRGSGCPEPVLPYQLGYVAPPAPDAAPFATPAASGPSLLDVLVQRLAGVGPLARTVWLPPLDRSPTLDELLPATADRAFPTLAVPIGLVDRPFEQRRDPHRVELASAHFVVVGRPQSGKSTVLRSLIAAMSLTHSPEHAQFYCLDFGGGTLTGLAGLPHVGSVATRLEPDRVRRTIAEIEALLAGRERLFAESNIDSMATYRRLVAAGSVVRDGFGDVFLVVDGWGTLRSDFEALEAAITQLAARGLGYGVHVIVSVQRWMELRPALRDLMSNRLELRLGDPAESEFDRRVAVTVPEGCPGRGMTAAKLHTLTALPRIDGGDAGGDLVAGVADLVTRVQRDWTGSPSAPPVRLLPAELPYEALPAVVRDGARLPIGIDEDALAPVFADLDAEAHLLVVGDTESGKSTLLRTLACGITTRWAPDQARVVVFDYRRGLFGDLTSAHQLAHVTNPAAASDAAADIVAALRERVAGMQPDRGRPGGWPGPRLFVLVDDYELVASGAGSSGRANPLHGLLEFLPQARDIGLHLILSRCAGGAGQGMFEPLVRTLRELGTPGVLLSGSRDEGTILGSTRLEPLPPGRGRLVHRRHGARLIQTAHLQPGAAIARGGAAP